VYFLGIYKAKIMASLLELRRISGKGVIRRPLVASRVIYLFIDVIRPGISADYSFKYNPAKSRYCTVVLLQGGRVIGEEVVSYPETRFTYFADPSAQILFAIKCSYAGNLKSIYNLSVALAATPGSVGLSPISITNTIADFTGIDTLWDEARIVCEGTVAIEAQIWGEPYQLCDSTQAPPIRPPVVTHDDPVSPLASVSVSPPYAGDASNTQPNDADHYADPTAHTLTFDYVDLYDSAQSSVDNLSGTFYCFPPITVGAVSYSRPAPRPSGSFLWSDVTITDNLGSNIVVPLIRNTYNGHQVSAIRLSP
jgi:hypothetical protein